MERITVITPTYNREKELNNLYQSLISQTCKDFIWMIIDDGSSDNTRKTVENFKEENKINIIYKYKENGGKHTALNLAFSILKTELEIIVDSDDTLTNNAIERIISIWDKYKKDRKICGIVFKRKDISIDRDMCEFKDKEFVDNYNTYIINKYINGDKAEIFRSDILKNYKYPEYKSERFLGEGVLWSKIARKYDMVFINESIYLCRYLEGGLTKKGIKMRINNPLGGMYHAEEYLDKIYSFKIREKNALLYLIYARFAKKNILKLSTKNKYTLLLFINFVPSLILFFYWKIKYI